MLAHVDNIDHETCDLTSRTLRKRNEAGDSRALKRARLRARNSDRSHVTPNLSNKRPNGVVAKKEEYRSTMTDEVELQFIRSGSRPSSRDPSQIPSRQSLSEQEQKIPIPEEEPPQGSDRDVRQERTRSYERDGFTIVCSRGRAVCFVLTCLFTVLGVAIIIAFARPANVCPCEEKKMDSAEINTKSTVLLSTTNEEFLQIFPWNSIRLPTFAHPTRYNISIHPNLTTTRVRGQVTIELYVDEDTKFIVFHSSGLIITEKMVQEQRKVSKLKIAKFLEYPLREQIYLELDSTFRRKTNYTLHLRFASKLSNELDGFYLSSYSTPSGETRHVAATHFEPTFARTAFPCFDEPQFKAKFKVSIYRDRFHIALCNMPVINTDEAGFYLGSSILRDDFQESVEMSTYLVAFVVCDFKPVTSKNRGDIHVYVAEHLLPQAVYAADTAADIMAYFESYFGIPYPLPKQDLIAIPNFASGAMENWGLITFREVAILLDPKETSLEAREGIAVTIAHELAHQWFGNLVTMKWWNDIWLNEGAASFFEYKGVHNFSPEWNIMDTFIIYKTQPALRLDALSNSHPINVSVEDPSEIESIFDEISYYKGSAVLYMLERFMGEDVFKAGLNDYLNLHAYKSADTDDLWAAFSRSLNNTHDIKAVMGTWTQQMGFPLIVVTRDGDTIKLYQKRFLMTPPKNKTYALEPKSPFDYKWYVPVTYYTDKQPHEIRKVWLNMTTVEIWDMSPYDIKYIKCNVNQTGFYRVNYTEDMWAEIINTLLNNHTMFSPADRANLIDDAFTLNEAGMLDIAIPLNLSSYLIHERDYVPWHTAQEFLHSWRKKLYEHTVYKKFTLFFRYLLRPVIKYVGWGNDGPHMKKFLRNSVMKSAVILGMDNELQPAKSLFDKWMDTGAPIPPDIRDVVYATGIKYGGEEAWFRCWETYQKTEVSSERQILLQALGVTTDTWLLQRYLLLSLNQDLIRAQDIGTVVWSVASNENGRHLAWRHIKAYWPNIQILFGNVSVAMSSLITDVVPFFNTEYDYREISEFFKHVEVGSGMRTLKQSLEKIKSNIHWVKHNGDCIDTVINNIPRTPQNNDENSTIVS
ncbi:glutamyl aminopeptidase-like isoform X3 [Odontomachus brunneus]|uniref:glutamyl aminopeptidase-like isoform X3 n=1 Tax=Odontomachus brunneus TaxID=486640 RepID=UPI0013F27524|nr:glutamyl aminopeptidase-like isoform X3 [Odontomachus brunneus]